jgi:hypothetical protein
MPKPARIVQAIVSIVATLLCCIASWIFLTRALGSTDFLVFYSAAKMAVAGRGAAVYDRTNLDSVEHALSPELPPGDYSPYLYPPQALLFLSPLGFLDGHQARTCWLGLMIGSLIGGLFVILRTYRIEGAARIWFVSLALLSGPVVWCILIGQFGTVLLLALALAVWAMKQGRTITAGAALAILLIKPHEALPLLLYLAGARRYQILSSVALWTVAGLLGGLALFGPAYYAGFIHSTLANLSNNANFINSQLGPTFRGVLLSIFGHGALVSAIALAALCAVYLFCFWLGRQMGQTSLWLEAGLLGCMPLGFAFALHFQDYDLLLLLPSVALLFSQPLLTLMPGALVALAALAGLLISTPIYLEAHTKVRNDKIANPYFLLLIAVQAAQLWFVNQHRQSFERDQVEPQ